MLNSQIEYLSRIAVVKLRKFWDTELLQLTSKRIKHDIGLSKWKLPKKIKPSIHRNIFPKNFQSSFGENQHMLELVIGYVYSKKVPC